MKAIIIGATGLIGSNLLKILEKDNYYDEIEVWVRKSFFTATSKTKTKIIDFDQLPDTITGQHVFCCVGSTIKKAKTKEAFRKVDFDIPVNIAKLCQKAAVEKLFVISSLGANQFSNNNYLKTKGEMESVISQLNIPTVTFLRPSILLGKRNEFRLGELIGKLMIRGIGIFFFGKLKKYRGIAASTVASAMCKLAKDNTVGKRIIESDEIVRIGK